MGAGDRKCLFACECCNANFVLIESFSVAIEGVSSFIALHSAAVQLVFSPGMFLYPRKGWSWDAPQELTLGYGFVTWRVL